MSAKWRRSKKHLKKFRIFEAMKTAKNRKTPPTVSFKNLKIKKHASPSIYRIPENFRQSRKREPEPLVDILEEKSGVIVVAEFIGFSRENLKIHVKNQCLTLSAKASDRRYYKSLNLPIEVIPNSIRTTYKNGVLEIRLKKTVKEKAVDRVAGLKNAT